MNDITRASKKEIAHRSKQDDEHREFLRIAFCGLVLRGYDRERDIEDSILRKVWRYGKRIQMENFSKGK